ncbi:MAG TPA: hypothetical protein VK325_02140 [Pseudoxanthomonas sp.]|nr:hypothetical protein [Pseudoxanthomonas sp.]
MALRLDQYPDRDFAAVEAQVRRRGAQFMTALRSQKPDVTVVMMLFLASTIRGIRPTVSGLGRRTPQELADLALHHQHRALRRPFKRCGEDVEPPSPGDRAADQDKAI